MAKKTKNAKRKVSMSARLRKAMDRISATWDLATVSTADIIKEAKKGLRGTERELFNPTAAQVSIVKREYTGGSPTGQRGRPSHESVGIVEEAA
jgi:hypothetical protein|tara:strand:+ start:771 stop:1052 length:282 start_codon:yes stop_codon:yes gene_type:complete